LLFITCVSGYAQEVERKVEGWFLLLNNHSFNGKWSVGNEFHFRQTNFLATRSQVIIRPHLTYTTANKTQYSLGYSFVSSNPYKSEQDHINPEHNIWQQVTLNNVLNKVHVSHRFRLEERFIGEVALQNSEYAVKSYDYASRFRYRITLRRDLSEKIFALVFDEFWLNAKHGLMPQAIDRNWISVALGYTFNDRLSAQMAYLHQWVITGKNSFSEKPTAQVVLQYDF